MPPPPRVPRATYRLQLNAGFTLRDALVVVPYLDDLGVSHLYVSSFLAARPGSLHGYDIVDHNAFNPEIGSEADLTALSAELDQRGMGLILDFVPNHMGIGGKDNAYWLDVLEWGENALYADVFDIDWLPGRRDMRGKVLYPILGDHYGAVLEKGELVPRLDREHGRLDIWYWDHRLPLRPADYGRLLRPALGDLADPARAALDDAVRLWAELAKGRQEERSSRAGRQRAALARQQLAAVVRQYPEAGDAIDAALGRLTAPSLHALLERQHYRVSYWRVAAAEINYRRFFDINDLAGLRQELPAVFEITHQLVFRLLAERKIHGLRIDHVDGLYNPAQYCQRLQRRARDLLERPNPAIEAARSDSGAEAKGADAPARRLRAHDDSDEQPLYLLVEKILAHHERLRRDWPVAGTTGYDFMNEVAGLFVDPGGQETLDAVYAGFIGTAMEFENEVAEAKRFITRTAMASELHVLGVQLGRLAASHWGSRDFTIEALREALREYVVQLPIYRTYFTPRRASEQDRNYVSWAIARARKGAVDEAIFDFLKGVLDTSLARGRTPRYNRARLVHLAMRLQQYSGPVMAKGFEDTALYRYNRLVSLNEVGGEPRRFGLSPAAFHEAMRRRHASHPHAMLATATHDSKRGEDVRLRIGVLSEIAEDWCGHVLRWSRMNQSYKRALDSGEAPEANDEYFLYQTMLGAWLESPAIDANFIDRLVAATLKATREAKRRTNWHLPDTAYEQAVEDFVRRICDQGRRNPFLEDFAALHHRLARLGQVYGLGQILLKLTCPGVPDVYQGTELWQLALVDPDNRRPVDFPRRRELLRQAGDRPLPELLAEPGDGAVKLALIQRVLGLRRALPQLFEHGSYTPLPVRGEPAGQVLAFARRWQDHTLVVAVPRLLARLWPDGTPWPPPPAAWRNVQVELPPGTSKFHDVLGDRDITATLRRNAAIVQAQHLFATFPGALLITPPPTFVTGDKRETA